MSACSLAEIACPGSERWCFVSSCEPVKAHARCVNAYSSGGEVHGYFPPVTCRYSAVLQVLSALPQATCQAAMRPTSPLLAGPSPSGGSSTPGSASWSYTPPPTCSEGSAHRQQPSAAYCELGV